MSVKPKDRMAWLPALVAALVILAIVVTVLAVKSCSAPVAQETEQETGESLVIELPEI